jgi:hypothetical protein
MLPHCIPLHQHAKLLLPVFDRLSEFAAKCASGAGVVGKRAVFAVVVIGNMVGLAWNFAAPPLFFKTPLRSSPLPPFLLPPATPPSTSTATDMEA